MGGKQPYSSMGPFGLPSLAEVVWPGAGGRTLRPDESGSSSEDQTAYEGHHSHHSRSSNRSTHNGSGGLGGVAAADLHSPRKAQKLVREIQEAIALLGGAGASAGAPGRAAFVGGGGSSRLLGDLGFPAFDPRDLTASGASRHSHQQWEGSSRHLPTSTTRMTSNASPTLNLQDFLRSGSNNLGERIGGNTPFLDEDFTLVDSPALLSGPAGDAFEFATRLPSFEAPGMPFRSQT